MSENTEFPAYSDVPYGEILSYYNQLKIHEQIVRSSGDVLESLKGGQNIYKQFGKSFYYLGNSNDDSMVKSIQKDIENSKNIIKILNEKFEVKK